MQFRSVWVSAGWLMIAIGIVFSLSDSSLVPMGLDDMGRASHWLAYFLSMAWFGQLYPSRSGNLRIALALIMLGIGLEVLQGIWTDRVASVSDVAANMVGITCGWLALRTRLSTTLPWLDRRLATVLLDRN